MNEWKRYIRKRLWDLENADRLKERKRLYEMRPEVKAKRRLYQQKRNKLKVRCRSLVNRGLISGKIIKKPCEVCGNVLSQGHHADYSNANAVTWLCDLHHREVHNKKAMKIEQARKIAHNRDIESGLIDKGEDI